MEERDERIEINRILLRIGGFGKWQRLQLAIISFLFLLFASYFNLQFWIWSWNKSDSKANITNWQDGLNKSAEIEYISYNHVTSTLTVCLMLLGFLLGVIAGYPLVSRYGRQRLLVVFTCIYGVCACLSPFAHFTSLFACLSIVMGFACGICIQASISIVLEWTSPHYHSVIFFVFACVSRIAVVLPLIQLAWNYEITSLVLTCPVFLVAILIIGFVRDSPKFLMEHGNIAGAEIVLRKVARINGHDFDGRVHRRGVHQTNSVSLRDLFKNRTTTKYLLVIILNWIIISSLHMILLFYFQIWSIGECDALCPTLSCLFEVGAMSLAFCSTFLLKRRPIILVSNVGVAIICIIILFTATDIEIILFRSSLLILGQSILCISMFTSIIWSSEMFATELRVPVLQVCTIAAVFPLPLITILNQNSGPTAVIILSVLLSSLSCCLVVSGRETKQSRGSGTLDVAVVDMDDIEMEEGGCDSELIANQRGLQ